MREKGRVRRGRRGSGGQRAVHSTAQLLVLEFSQYTAPTYAISFSLMTVERSGKMDVRFFKMADCKDRKQTVH